MTEAPLIEIRGLATHFATRAGVIRAVDGIDLQIRRGQTLCVVGESGSGKSITARSILQIVSPPGRVVAGSIMLRPRQGPPVDIAALDPRGDAIRRIRGGEIAMIFQEPMNSLSPVHSVGSQLVEKIRLHHPVTHREAVDRAVAALDRVGIPNARRRLDSYSFELSGGMRQRVMIAMALACQPALLIADEPTTALDVTTQAVILDLIKELQAETGMAVMFITHDLGVVAETADDVAVMYLGKIVEYGSADQIFYEPCHPYTQALLRSIPKLGARRAKGMRLDAIRGMVPHPFERPAACGFHTRCPEAVAGLCDRSTPADVVLAPGHRAACHLRVAGVPAPALEAT